MNIHLIGKHEKDPRPCRDGLALTLNEMMAADPSICYVDCDLMSCINTKQLRKNYPDRAFEAGIAEARNLLGLKKYLSEFTLVSERETPEVVLWQDYLTFATLFGIADKVAAQLKEINADIYRETVGGNDISVPETIYLSRFISRSIQSAVRAAEAKAAAQSASSGFGGSSSFGGGGGFSGGGFGGGSR